MQQVTPELSNLNQQIYYITVSVGQESGHSLAEYLWLKVYHKTAIKVATGAVFSSQGSTRGESVSRLTYVLASVGSFLAIGQRPPSGPCHVGPSIGQLITWQLASLRINKRVPESPQDGHQSFYN